MKKATLFFSLLLVAESVFAQDSKNVILLDNWANNSLPHTQDGNIFNEVWGFTVGQTEYAVIGATSGGYLFKISTEDKLVPVGVIPSRTTTLMGNIIHRDYKTYRNYLYCVSDESSGLQIVDINFLPDSVNIVYSSNTLFSYVHNIYIDTAKAMLYACGNINLNSIYYNIAVYSLADPVNPQLVSVMGGHDYVHDAFVRNDTAYLNCGNVGLYVYKYDNGDNPQLLGYLDYYPDKGFNHSGWLSENGKYYVFADETTGMKMKICDVSDLTDITVLDLFNSGTVSATIQNGTIPHNLMWKDDYIYVSHYFDGLQIFDASDKSNVKRVAWYDTHLQNSIQYSGAWGVYCFLKDNKVLISDRTAGLFLFRTNLPPRINSGLEHGIYPNPGNGETVFYLSDETPANYRFKVFDVLGKLIYSEENIPNNYLRFNTSSWASGSYYYQWEGMDNDIKLNGKFLVVGE